MERECAMLEDMRRLSQNIAGSTGNTGPSNMATTNTTSPVGNAAGFFNTFSQSPTPVVRRRQSRRSRPVGEGIPCPECGSIFSRNDVLTRHRREQHEFVLKALEYYCHHPDCSHRISYARFCNYRQHMLKVHGVRVENTEEVRSIASQRRAHKEDTRRQAAAATPGGRPVAAAAAQGSSAVAAAAGEPDHSPGMVAAGVPLATSDGVRFPMESTELLATSLAAPPSASSTGCGRPESSQGVYPSAGEALSSPTPGSPLGGGARQEPEGHRMHDTSTTETGESQDDYPVPRATAAGPDKSPTSSTDGAVSAPLPSSLVRSRARHSLVKTTTGEAPNKHTLQGVVAAVPGNTVGSPAGSAQTFASPAVPGPPPPGPPSSHDRTRAGTRRGASNPVPAPNDFRAIAPAPVPVPPPEGQKGHEEPDCAGLVHALRAENAFLARLNTAKDEQLQGLWRENRHLRHQFSQLSSQLQHVQQPSPEQTARGTELENRNRELAQQLHDMTQRYERERETSAALHERVEHLEAEREHMLEYQDDDDGEEGEGSR
ncbi:hypothetical protein F5Y17DRAFT_454507 [Xylariaceae sp. FL0594]|nr:hypothetical protein F5Y17DRAFT_454507 [Xylariaceae sp. FL0594]